MNLNKKKGQPIVKVRTTFLEWKVFYTLTPLALFALLVIVSLGSKSPQDTTNANTLVTPLSFYTSVVQPEISITQQPVQTLFPVPTPNVVQFEIDALDTEHIAVFQIPAEPLIKPNLQELELIHSNDKVVLFIASLVNGDLVSLTDTGNWFQAQTLGTPGYQAREDISNAIVEVTLSDLSVSDGVWVANMIQGLKSLGYLDKAGLVQTAYIDLVNAEASVAQMNIPAYKEQISQKAAITLTTDTLVLEQHFQPLLMGDTDSVVLGLGLGHSPALVLHNLHRLYALIMAQAYSPYPKTPYVVEVSELNIFPILWDQKVITLPVVGEVRKVLVLLGEDPNMNPAPTLTEWRSYMGPDRQYYEGYSQGKYWRASTIYFIKGFSLKKGDVISAESPLFEQLMKLLGQ